MLEGRTDSCKLPSAYMHTFMNTLYTYKTNRFNFLNVKEDVYISKPRLKQKDHRFEASLGYIIKTLSQKQSNICWRHDSVVLKMCLCYFKRPEFISSTHVELLVIPAVEDPVSSSGLHRAP